MYWAGEVLIRNVRVSLVLHQEFDECHIALDDSQMERRAIQAVLLVTAGSSL